jgi:hypothetical protein
VGEGGGVNKGRKTFHYAGGASRRRPRRGVPSLPRAGARLFLLLVLLVATAIAALLPSLRFLVHHNGRSIDR